MYVYLKSTGRISRKTYWFFSIPLALIGYVTERFIEPTMPLVSVVILVALIYPAMMVNIKRAHDRGRSGWFAALIFIPIVSLWPFVEFAFIKGTDGDNTYGAAVINKK